MIELRMTFTDFTQLRFAYSPLSEAIYSLRMLHAGQVHLPYRRWAQTARERLRHLDTTLLRAIAPADGAILSPPVDLTATNTVQRQLQLLARWPPGLMRAELESIWHGRPMPEAARQVIADGPPGNRRVARALGVYWDTVLAPDWDQMRAVLDADIAYRAQQATLGGIAAMLKDVHPGLQLHESTIRLHKNGHRQYDLDGKGVLLIPSVFADSHLLFDPGSRSLPTIDYAPRSLGTVWDSSSPPAAQDPVTALIGASRTAILRNAELPRTTTELARELGLSGASISVHLSILKGSGMVTSWRSGRRVLYQRTPLAASI